MRLSDYILHEINKVYDVMCKAISTKLPKIELIGGLAFGAGDSYASALTLQYLSNLKFHAVDPLYIVKNCRELCKCESVYVAFSYKGKTKNVVKAVKELRKYRCKVVAVTSEPTSQLGQNADIVVEVPKTYEALPVGIGSFIAMATIAARMIRLSIDTYKLRDILSISRKNEVIIENLREPLNNVNEIVIVSNGIGVASGYYICLKFHEALCMPCRVYPYEELLHAALFSIRKDSLMLFFIEDMNEVGVLSNLLTNEGVPYTYVVSRDEGFSKFLTYVIKGLRILHEFVKASGLDKPCSMERRKILKATTPMIYY